MVSQIPDLYLKFLLYDHHINSLVIEEVKNCLEMPDPDGKELFLDGIKFQKFTTTIKEAIGTISYDFSYIPEKIDGLLRLTLNDCEIDSLDNFPNLPSLEKVHFVNSNHSFSSKCLEIS